MPCKNCGKKRKMNTMQKRRALDGKNTTVPVNTEGYKQAAKVAEQNKQEQLLQLLSVSANMMTTLRTLSGQCVTISGSCPALVVFDKKIEALQNQVESLQENVKLGSEPE